jgi:hypothetical protein
MCSAAFPVGRRSPEDRDRAEELQRVFRDFPEDRDMRLEAHAFSGEWKCCSDIVRRDTFPATECPAQ